MEANRRERKKIGNWLLSDDTGLSSLSLAAIALGSDREWGALRAPCDPNDFRRCYNFLEECIDKSNRLTLVYKIAEHSQRWEAVRENWLALVKLWQEEKEQGTAPKLYELMKQIGL